MSGIIKSIGVWSVLSATMASTCTPGTLPDGVPSTDNDSPNTTPSPLPDVDQPSPTQPGPNPQPTPPPQATKLGELLLGGVPGNIALDLARHLGYVGVDHRVRRFDSAQRVWKANQTPNGVFYGLDEEDDLMARLNPATGKVNQIYSYPQSFPITPDSNAGYVTGMDYNPDTGMLYMIDIFALGRAATLFEFDPATGVRTQIGDTGLEGNDGPLAEVFSLARDPATGLLYTVDVLDRLWRIDPVTATATLIGPLSANPTEFANVQGLSFSPLDGKLYGINPPLNGPVQIVTIDIGSGAGALVTELPLGYTGGSLAFKPDGTLWSVNLLGIRNVVTHTDFLYRIDYSTNPATTFDFPTLEFSMESIGFNVLFQGIDSLCFAPQAAGDQTVPTFQEIDAVGVSHDGGVMASAGSSVIGFDPDFAIFPSGINAGGLESFRSIVIDPTNDLAYVRDGNSGKVHEFDPGQEGVTNTIQYRPASAFYAIPRQPDSGIDPVNHNLYLVGDFQMHRVNVFSGVSDEIDDGANDNPEGIIVDGARRRLHVNMQFGGPGNCGSIRTYNLDTMQVLNNICGDGPQLFNMAFDPVRNRIAVNCRTSTQFDMAVRIFNMTTFEEESFSPISLPMTADHTNALAAFLAFDTDRNQLLIARPDTPARLEFYQLPN